MEQNQVEKSVPGALSPARIMGQQEKADTGKASAGFNAHAFGQAMAKDYYESAVVGMKTWCSDVIKLLAEHAAPERETAMKAAIEYAKSMDTKGDGVVVDSIKKRVSESRRIFKAAGDVGGLGTDKVLKILRGKGTWHQKVAACPTVTNKGPKKKNGPTLPIAPKVDKKADAPVALGPIQQAMLQAEATDKNIPQKPGSSMLGVGQITKACADLSIADACKVLDNLLEQLKQQKQDTFISGMAKAMLDIKDKHDNMEIKKASSM